MNSRAPARAGRQYRGRIDKRNAVLDAALAVFARVGFEQAGMDTVAAEAGVAKPTIYNHFGDKETLLREVLGMVTDDINARGLIAVHELRPDAEDLTAALAETGVRLMQCLACQQAVAVRQLLAAESVRFPELLTEAQTSGLDRMLDLLAARLAAMERAGRLALSSPEVAARHFFALISNELLIMSSQGARIDEPTLHREVESGVDTFLRAFAVR